ncbi:MAG: DUF3604 domain-containing protein [Elusimicrobiota bacterium]
MKTYLPLRLPKDILFGEVKPKVVIAGEKVDWQFRVVLPQGISGKQKIVFLIGGTRWQSGYWQTRPQMNNSVADGYLYAKVNDTVNLEAISTEHPLRIEFKIPQAGIPSGAKLEISWKKANALPFTLKNCYFLLVVVGTEENKHHKQIQWLLNNGFMKTAFLVDIVGGKRAALCPLVPADVVADKPFNFIVRVEDQLGNTSSGLPEEIIVKAEGITQVVKVTQEAVNPGGAVMVNNFVLTTLGTTRIEVSEPKTGLAGISNPVVVTKTEPEQKLFWGLIHEHTEMSDGLGTLETCYNNFRYADALDFGATSDHDHKYETNDELWSLIQNSAKVFNNPGEFVSFLGYEWAKWRRNGDGDRNVYYLKDNRPMYRSETGEYDNPNKLFAALKNEDAIVIPHHSAHDGNYCDWKDHDPEKERLVEIYSVWGNSELATEQGNTYPGGAPSRMSPNRPENSVIHGENPLGFVQRGLTLGWRIGFTAGGDMHCAHPGSNVRKGFPPYNFKPGLLGVWAKEKTRESIFHALWSRRCYATTSARIRVDYTINGYPMGSEIVLTESKGMNNGRIVEINVNGTSIINKVEILRNNVVIRSIDGNSQQDLVVKFEDNELLDKLWLPPARWSKEPFIFYYVRIHQVDGEMAWASPVWVLNDR